jgi:hypothetical protein
VNIDKSKFLAISSALAAATALAAGCTIVSTNNPPPAGVDSGVEVDSGMMMTSDGSTMMNGDSAVNTDASPSGDAGPKSDGSVVTNDAASDSGPKPACLDDSATPGAMAPCVTTAMTCLATPEGEGACYGAGANVISGVGRAISACLDSAATCGPTTIDDCIKSSALQACEKPAVRAVCTQTVAACKALGMTPQISEDECTKLGSALNGAGFASLSSCFTEAGLGGCGLANDACFQNAVNPPL